MSRWALEERLAFDCDSNVPVGFMPSWDYTLQEAEVYAGTTIFMYTDGLTEAMNINDEMFRLERVKEIATEALSHHQQDPKNLIRLMTDAAHHFVGDAEQSDDMTMMAIQFIKKSNNSDVSDNNNTTIDEG